jgi:membrane associated rhomboid family serine protease
MRTIASLMIIVFAVLLFAPMILGTTPAISAQIAPQELRGEALVASALLEAQQLQAFVAIAAIGALGALAGGLLYMLLWIAASWKQTHEIRYLPPMSEDFRDGIFTFSREVERR